MLIAKFGGTSVASAKRIRTIIEIIRSELKRQPVLVVSALSGVTDLLLKGETNQAKKIHQRLVDDLFGGDNPGTEIMKYVSSQLNQAQEVASRKNLSPRDLDELASYGEIISSFIISQALNEAGIPSMRVIAKDLIVTDDNFTQAEFLPKETRGKTLKSLTPLITKGVVPVVTGFIGSTKAGRVTTLGRGGSDYSASILGYCLGAEEIQIWTDVDGIFSADPRVVKNARLIPQISYREASEMASFGARVLHPRTMRPAIEKNIPVRVLNSFNPQSGGTLIISGSSTPGLKAVSYKRRTTLINIYSTNMLFSRGFLARVFEVFARENISVDLVSVSEVSVSVTLDNVDHLDRAVKKLKEFSTVSVSKEYGMISLIGEGIATFQDLIRDVSELFSRNMIPIRMISLGASDINISLVLPSEDIKRAVNLVHDRIIRNNSENSEHQKFGRSKNQNSDQSDLSDSTGIPSPSEFSENNPRQGSTL